MAPADTEVAEATCPTLDTADTALDMDPDTDTEADTEVDTADTVVDMDPDMEKDTVKNSPHTCTTQSQSPCNNPALLPSLCPQLVWIQLLTPPETLVSSEETVALDFSVSDIGIDKGKVTLCYLIHTQYFSDIQILLFTNVFLLFTALLFLIPLLFNNNNTSG